jgi:hypothetical protein
MRVIASIALLLVVVVSSAVAKADGILQSSTAVEAFTCEVCRIFCIEYEKKIGEKNGDDPFEVAVEWARGNTSHYRWDEKHNVLRSPGQPIGVPADEEILSHLDTDVLTPSNQQVVLHALHAAGHVQRPPQMNSHFCRRVLCDQHLKHCPPHPDNRPFGEMTQAYQKFVDHFDARHPSPQKEHDIKGFNGRHDAHRSAVRERYTDPATGRFNPAEMDADTRERMRFEMEEAERAARRSVNDEL